MHVLLAAEWTDATGLPYRAGDVVDVDVVTLAELEVLGVVEDLNAQETPASEKPGKTGRIGPGPTAPPQAPGEGGGDGPSVPEPKK